MSRDGAQGLAFLALLQGFIPSVADPDPGSVAFLTPGSGILDRFFPDPGSQTHIFELSDNLLGKSNIIL